MSQHAHDFAANVAAMAEAMRQSGGGGIREVVRAETRTEVLPPHFEEKLSQVIATMNDLESRFIALEHHLSTHTHETIRTVAA